MIYVYDTFSKRKKSYEDFNVDRMTWVGRRKEPILGYVPKYDEKRIQAVKG